MPEEVPTIVPLPMSDERLSLSVSRGRIEIFRSNKAREGLSNRQTETFEDSHANSGCATWLLIGQARTPMPNRRQQSLICHEMLAALLLELHPNEPYLKNANPEDTWALSYEPSGAPVLLQHGRPGNWRVSFSHSGDLCAVALSAGFKIAVDIERTGSRRNFAAMNEYMNWPTEDRNEHNFLSRWTLWEACAKLSSKSVLSRKIDGFAALERRLRTGQIIQADGISALQLDIGGSIWCTLLMKNHNQVSLDFRHWPGAVPRTPLPLEMPLQQKQVAGATA